jgi:hypothetical protein
MCTYAYIWKHYIEYTQRLSHEVGWGYKDVVDRLEEKRKIKAQAFHERKVNGCPVFDCLG